MASTKKLGSYRSQLDMLVTIGAGIFAGAAIFEIVPESARSLGWIESILLMFVGTALWWLLKSATNNLSKNAFAITASLAVWLHSSLEGAITAVGLRLGGVVAVGIAVAMLLHLLPEFFAVVAILSSEGFSFKKSVLVDVVTIIVLFISFGIAYKLLPGLGIRDLTILEAISAGAFLYIAAHSLAKRLSWRTAMAATVGAGIMLMFRLLQ